MVSFKFFLVVQPALQCTCFLLENILSNVCHVNLPELYVCLIELMMNDDYYHSGMVVVYFVGHWHGGAFICEAIAILRIFGS